MWWETLLAAAAGLLLLWLLLLAALWFAQRAQNEPASLREALRLLPDVLRLLRRLASDKTLPVGVRVRLWLLLGYLLSPIDLVPDFIPVIGYADDAIIIVLALRSVIRTAGPEALERHWPGTQQGLRSLLILLPR
ncbi:YkvA family protein [Arthrobacter sp. H14]|uniref:YkvA family protein n=1 Tax=Arthrobacter sp. H14 TaxID=1312959 RepID=UPI000478CE8F|nr:YkvA family protein [Arthrobacter sp. H14]